MFCDQPYLGNQDTTAAAAGPWPQGVTQAAADRNTTAQQCWAIQRVCSRCQANCKGGGLSWLLQRLVAVFTPGKHDVCCQRRLFVQMHIRLHHCKMLCTHCHVCAVHPNHNQETCHAAWMKSLGTASDLSSRLMCTVTSPVTSMSEFTCHAGIPWSYSIYGV